MSDIADRLGIYDALFTEPLPDKPAVIVGAARELIAEVERLSRIIEALDGEVAEYTSQIVEQQAAIHRQGHVIEQLRAVPDEVESLFRKPYMYGSEWRDSIAAIRRRMNEIVAAAVILDSEADRG